MGIGRRSGLRTGMRAVLLIIAVLVVSPVAGRHAGAANLSIVTGLVKSVSATELDVNGKTYNITGVPLRTATGKPVSPTEIQPGTKVDIYYRGDKILFVHVYPYRLVE